MHVPRTFPGLKLATGLLVAYFAIWIALEGDLVRAALLGTATSAVALGHVAQRWLGGQHLTRERFLVLAGAFGIVAGFAGAMLTLVFMAVKTGLHAHGPEFTVEEIEWIVNQVPWWTTAGLLAGLGLGLIAVAARSR